MVRVNSKDFVGTIRTPCDLARQSHSWWRRHQYQLGRCICKDHHHHLPSVFVLTDNQDSSNALFTVNGVSFEPPTVPVLLQILSGAKNASDLLPAGSIYGLAPNQSVELTIPGGVLGIAVSIRVTAYYG